MPAMLLQFLLPILLGFGAKRGLSALLAKTALSQGAKTAIPAIGEWAGFLGPGIYDAMKAGKADDVQISSNHGNMQALQTAMASPPPVSDNVSSMLALMGQSDGSDDLMRLLNTQTL